MLQLVIIALISFSSVSAQSGTLDPTFNGGVALQPTRNITAIKRQMDGRILVGGNYEVANGALRYGIVRLNADSTVDPTFNPPDTLLGVVRGIEIQPDGKIIIAGNFVIPLLTNFALVVRLNADGSYDTTFAAHLHNSPDGTANDVALTPDGKVTIAGNFNLNVSGVGTRINLARFNSDGTLDTVFSPSNLVTPINDIETTTDGKIVGITTDGGSGSRFVKRFNPDGNEDLTFNALVTGQVNTLKIQPDGKLLIGGNITFVNNVARNNTARLNADGSLDTSFNVVITSTVVGQGAVVYDIDLDAAGNILIGGFFSSVNGTPRRNLVRVNAAGTVDTAFGNNLANLEFVRVLLPLPDSKIIAAISDKGAFNAGDSAIRLNNDGTIDDSFSLRVGVRGIVTDIVVQPDGKILVAGDLGAINQFNRLGIARFNADGTADTTFDPPLPYPPNNPFATQVRAIALQADGKILVGGQFWDGSVNPPRALLRLNSDGSLDNSFNPAGLTGSNFLVFDILVQPDGKIVTFPGNPNCGCQLAAKRYNTNGSLDSSFSATFNDSVNRAVLQPNGKFLVGGAFSQVNGTPRGRIARLNADGTLDNTLNPLGGANNVINDLALQTDGKIVIGGNFTSYNGSGRNYFARLNTDGNLDGSFTATVNDVVRAIKIELSGKVVIGGSFTTAGGVSRNKIARFNSDGSLDLSLNIGTGINGVVHSLALQPDNKIVVGGNFTKYNDIGRISIVRLLNNSAARTPYDFDGDGKADLSVFRPSNSVWYQLNSTNNQQAGQQFGASGDVIAPADFDGDGKTDLAVYRGGVWYIQRSALGFTGVQFGLTTDLPVPADYDGDGKADIAVWRPSNGTWYRLNSSNGQVVTVQFGQTGDKPTLGDFDGNGLSDIAVFRPSNGVWYRINAQNQQVGQQFGQDGDSVVPADYDGDGKTDLAVYRPAIGTWYILRSSLGFTGVQFGSSADKPAPADYDGDGRADVTVFRPSNGVWYQLRSTQGFAGTQFGITEDLPIPNAFVR